MLGSGSLPLGSLFGIPIRLHVLFFVVLGAQLLGAIPAGKEVVLLWFVILGPVLLITILIHEIGHCLAARYVGGTVDGILLWPLGGLAFIGHNAGPKADILVSVAGPLTHVPMIGIWLLGLAAATSSATGSFSISLKMPYPDKTHFAMAMCCGALIMNMFLMAFNLLVPAYPLDGGRILVDSLLACGMPAERTATVACGVSLPLALAIMVWGFIDFQVVTIMVGFFILMSTYQLWQAKRSGALSNHPLFSFEQQTASQQESHYQPFAPTNSAKV